MLKINDKFCFPQINEFKDEFLIKDQQYFWFLPKDGEINTEICNIILNNDKYEFINKKFHQPSEYLNNLEDDIKTYHSWGITNNNDNNYYDLKVDTNGIFYNQTQNNLISYKIILKYKNNLNIEKNYELTKSNLKFINAFLFKEGHAFLTINQSNNLSLDNFIVGYSAELNTDQKIKLEITAIIPNTENKYYPQFTIKITPSTNKFFCDLNIDSIIKYEKIDIEEEYQEIPAGSTTEINLQAIGYNE